MEYLSNGNNIADIFTKPLAKVTFVHFVSMLGLEELVEQKVWSQHNLITTDVDYR